MHLLAFLLFALASLSVAADPDWPRVEQHAVEFLQQYLRIETVNPPANTAPAAELFRVELEKAGLTAKVYRAGPEGQTNLLVRLPGRDRSKKPLLLLNHFDVVPVDRKAWPLDPFAGIIRDGQIWGRGSLDMKGTGTQHLMALIALKQAGITPSRDIVMVTTSDEETAGPHGIKWMIANHYEEFAPEYVLDEGGFGTRDVLSPNRLTFGIAVGEKQMLWIRLRARGTAGHGSQPIPDNANLRLLRAIEKALDLPKTSRENPVVAELRANLSGNLATNKFTSAIQQNTISLTTLTAGVGSPVKINVIPSSSEASFDCRLLPGVNNEEFISEMKARINDPNVTVEKLVHNGDPGASPSATPLFAVIREAIRKTHPTATVTPLLIPYGTDSNRLREKGVTAYGLAPMVLDAATVATMHSDAERIPLEEFKKGIRIFFEVLKSEF